MPFQRVRVPASASIEMTVMQSDPDVLQKYESWHETMASEELMAGGSLLHPWHRSAAQHVGSAARRRVLEIGCGRGDFTLWLAKHSGASEVVGVDFSHVAIATARQRAQGVSGDGCDVSFSVGNAEELTFEDESFDMVISCECMEHVMHPQIMAQEIRRVLRPQGRFVITTENYFNGMLLAWLQTWVTGKPFDSGSGVQPHENFFLFWRVRRILERAGLSVDRMASSHYQWLLLPGFDPAKLCTATIDNPVLSRLCRPFGRHFTFAGSRVS